MDRRYKPSAHIYDGLQVSPSVYLFEMGDCVKVGHTVSPIGRFIALNKYARERCWTPGRYAIYAQGAMALLPAERAAIRALKAVATPLAGGREFFVGVTFDAAKTVVETALAVAQPTQSGDGRLERASPSHTPA